MPLFGLHHIPPSIPDIDLALTRKQEQRYKAENMWRNTRFLWPPNKNAEVDRELRNRASILTNWKKIRKPVYQNMTTTTSTTSW